MVPELPPPAAGPGRRPFPMGRRGLVILVLLVIGAWAWMHLELDAGDLIVGRDDMATASEFLARAFTPALTHEDEGSYDTPLLTLSLQAAGSTIAFAGAGMGLSILFGLILGFFASTAWWGERGTGRSPVMRALTITVAPTVYAFTRTFITLMRSVHELWWALLFLIIFPTTPTSAVLAIAIPYGGTLAKIYSEMIDEASRAPALALKSMGASGLQVYGFGLIPTALPDMTAYTFYRFECALRSATVLGFFGTFGLPPTLGVRIREAFGATDYGEAWTHLWMLVILVVVFDWWSGAVRRRLVG